MAIVGLLIGLLDMLALPIRVIRMLFASSLERFCC